MEFVVTDSEAEALLLENNLIKRFRPRFNVLLRDDKSFPYIVIRGDTDWPQLAKHRGARERARRVFRALRLGRRGQPHALRAAARLPAALLLRRRVRHPHAALPAVPDQALHGALRRAHRQAEDYDAHRRRGARLPGRAKPRGAAALAQRMSKASSEAWSSSAPRCCATASARSPHIQSHQVDQPAVDRRGRHLRRPCRTAARSACRCSSSAPARISATAPISRATTASSTRRGAVRLHRPVLRQQAAAAADPDQPRRRRARAAGEALAITAGHKVEIRTPEARRPKDALDQALRQRARGAGPAPGRERHAAPAAGGRGRGCSASTRRPSASRSTTTATSRAAAPVGAMIVAGPDGFIKNAYRKFNIKTRGARRATTSP